MAIKSFLILDGSGAVVSQETDSASQRLSDQDLAAKGLTRINDDGRLAVAPPPVVSKPLTAKASALWTLADVADWLKGAR